MEFAVFLAVVVFFVLLTSVVIVRQGYEYTVESFGRFTRTLSPGLHIIIPIVERVGAKINRMEQVLDVPSQDVITKDNATVRVDGVLFFQIQQAANAAYQVKDLNVAILNLIMTNIRTVIGSMEIAELLQSKIRDILPSLSEKEAYILEHRLLTDDPVTLREIGERYNVTRERVRQLEARLLQKLKTHLSTDIQDFSEDWISH